MKLDFSAILNPVQESISSPAVTGTIGESTVVVSRYLKGWKPAIKVTINDVVLHDAEPTDEEMVQFNTLAGRAADEASDRFMLKRNTVATSEAFHAIFGK